MTAFLFSLPVWLVLTAVVVLPALESSVFLGFLFPGETALLVGGVVAAGGRLPVWAVIGAAVVGAVLGDAIGFTVGRRWGRQMLAGSLGRFVSAEHLDRTEAALARMGGSAVLVGRFTVALRVLIPGLAGMSGMGRRTFTAWNLLGALLWAPAVVLLGLLGGASWQHLAHVATWAGTAVVAGLVLLWLAVHLLRRRRVRRAATEQETGARDRRRRRVPAAASRG